MIANGNDRQSCNGARARRSGERGYVLIVFVLLAALLLVGLSTILPKAAFEGQREREEELIFRGMQYQRAVQLFFRKFGRYPNSVDELLKTNGFRFLRKRFKDPMTKDGEWRLIHVGPGGVFIDALTSPVAPVITGASPAAGSNASPQGGAGLGPSPQQLQPGGLFPPGTGQQNPGQPSSTGFSPIPTPTAGLPGIGTQPNDPTLAPSANPGLNPLQPRAAAQDQPSSQGTSAAGATDASSSSQQATSTTIIGGGPIAGFASMNKNDSIRVWNTYSEYDKWEFIYNPRQDPVAATALARAGGAQAQPLPQPQTGAQPRPGPQPNMPGFTFPQFPPIPIPGAPSQPR